MWTRYSLVIISLPGLNVARFGSGGPYSPRAWREWFAAQPDSSVAFSRIMQIGCFRLLTNANVMGGAPRTVAQAWGVFAQLRMDRRLLFLSEPDGAEPVWRELMMQRGVGPSLWTDAYLAAFCKSALVFTGDLRPGVYPLGRIGLNLLQVPPLNQARRRAKLTALWQFRMSSVSGPSAQSAVRVSPSWPCFRRTPAWKSIWPM